MEFCNHQTACSIINEKRPIKIPLQLANCKIDLLMLEGCGILCVAFLFCKFNTHFFPICTSHLFDEYYLWHRWKRKSFIIIYVTMMHANYNLKLIIRWLLVIRLTIHRVDRAIRLNMRRSIRYIRGNMSINGYDLHNDVQIDAYALGWIYVIYFINGVFVKVIEK